MFTAPDGSVALVNITRSNQAPIGATPVWKTFIAYSFCINPGNYACLNGFGTVPNSAFKGNLTANYLHPDVLTVYVDTSTLPGFLNQLCHSPDANGTCTQGEVYATGGIIGITFTKTPIYADLKGTTEKLVQDGTIGFVGYTNDTFSSAAQGTVMSAPGEQPDADLSAMGGDQGRFCRGNRH